MWLKERNLRILYWSIKIKMSLKGHKYVKICGNLTKYEKKSSIYVKKKKRNLSVKSMFMS